jgi:hypothetical protein
MLDFLEVLLKLKRNRGVGRSNIRKPPFLYQFKELSSSIQVYLYLNVLGGFLPIVSISKKIGK